MSVSITSQIQLVQYFGSTNYEISSLGGISNVDTIYRISNGLYEAWINGNEAASNFSTLDPEEGYLIISNSTDFVLDDGETDVTLPPAISITESIQIKKYFGASLDLDGTENSFQQVYKITDGIYNVWIKDGPANSFNTLEDGETYLLLSDPNADFPIPFCVITVGEKLYCLSPSSNQVKIMDVTSKLVIGNINIKENAIDMKIDNARGLLYVLISNPASILVIDLLKGYVIQEILLYTYLQRYVPYHKIDLHNNEIFCISSSDSRIFIIDALSYSVKHLLRNKDINSRYASISHTERGTYLANSTNKYLERIEDSDVIHKVLDIFPSSTNAFFGNKVVHDNTGNRLAVQDDDKKISVFARYNNRYIPLGQKITIDGSISSFDFSGNGLNIIVGSSTHLGGGVVTIFEFNGTSWQQKGPSIMGDSSDFTVGHSVCTNFNGTIAYISAAEYNLQSSKLICYKYNINSWDILDSVVFTDILLTERIQTNDAGSIVALSNSRGFGEIHTYSLDESNNTLSMLDEPIVGPSNSSRYGSDISLDSSGLRLAVSSYRHEIAVFEFVGANGWRLLGNKLDKLAYSCSLSGDGMSLVIGNYSRDIPATNAGEMSVFKLYNNKWEALDEPVFGKNQDDNLGYSVSINNDGTIFSCSIKNGDLYGTDIGLVSSYEYN